MLKTLIRYPGGKSRAVKMLTPLTRDDHTTILSPFFGGGSFELELVNNKKTVRAYDGFPILANFWNTALYTPETLADHIDPWVGHITPENFRAKQETLKKLDTWEKVLEHGTILAATDFYIVNRCSFSGTTLSGGYSKESAVTRFTQSGVDRLRNFKNDNKDSRLSVDYGLFESTLVDIPETVDLLFLDPPYLLPTNKNNLYGIGGDLHESFNHALLHELVETSGKDFLLTYNDCPEIRELWKDYEIVEADWSYGMNKSKKSSEIFIKNYSVEEPSQHGTLLDLLED